MIRRCSGGHFFIGKSCPFCKRAAIANIPYQAGDCIDCGALCPGYAYGCTQPNPLSPVELEAATLEVTETKQSTERFAK